MLPAWLGLAGQVMMAVGLIVSLAAVVMTLPAALAARRRARSLRVAMATEGRPVVAALAVLARQRGQAARDVAEVNAVLSWLRHPLVAATLTWARRRPWR